MVGVADHERVAALDAVKAKVEKTKNTIDRSKAENVRLAETLTSLRSEVAEQEKKLADTNGFLQ